MYSDSIYLTHATHVYKPSLRLVYLEIPQHPPETIRIKKV